MHRIPREMARSALRYSTNTLAIGAAPRLANALYNSLPLSVLDFLTGHEIIQQPKKAMRWRVAFPGGGAFKVQVTPHDFYAYHMALRWRQSDPGLKKTLSVLLKANKQAFSYLDVGSNIGTTAVEALAQGCPVWMFEPNSSLNAFVEELAAANGWSNYFLNNVALSDYRGTAKFFLSKTSFLSSFDKTHAESEGRSDEEKVLVRKLDDFLDQFGSMPPPKILKIDVEGHELQVLAGAEKVLALYQPTLLIEVLPDGPRQEVFTLLAGSGYCAFGIRDTHSLALTALGDRHNYEQYPGINFLFMKSDDVASAALQPYVSD